MSHRAALALLLAACVTAVAHPQQSVGFGSGGGGGSSVSRAISPSVVSAIWSHDDDDHVPVLEMLILLRGSPGWFAVTGLGTNGYNFSSSNGRSTGHTFATSAGVTVAIDSDSSVPTKKLTVVSNLMTVLDRQIAPGDVNVILVDRVDASPGQPIVELRSIEPRLIGEGGALARAIKGSPELFDFLQCDTQMPDNLARRIAPLLRALRTSTSMCDQMRPGG